MATALLPATVLAVLGVVGVGGRIISVLRGWHENDSGEGRER